MAARKRLHEFAYREDLTQLTTSFAQSLIDRAHVRKANGANVEAWGSYPGKGGLVRYAFVATLARPGSGAHTKILDARSDWRDRFVWGAWVAHAMPAGVPTTWPGHPSDVQLEDRGWYAGYTRLGMASGAGAGDGHIRLGDNLHLYASTTGGFLALDLHSVSAEFERLSVGLVIFATEQLGQRSSPVAVPALVGGSTIAPADLNRIQDPAVFAQVQAGIPAGQSVVFTPEAVALGPATKGGPTLPDRWTTRGVDARQPAHIGARAFLAQSIANNVEQLLDDSVDWRNRIVTVYARYSNVDIVPGGAQDTSFNGGAVQPRVFYSGSGRPTGTPIVTPQHLTLFTSDRLAVFVDEATGGLYLRNESGATQYIALVIQATPQIGKSPPLATPYAFGKALSFDGIDDWVEVADHSSFPTSAASLDLWSYQDAVSGNRPLYGKGTSINLTVLARVEGANLRVYIGDTSTYGQCPAPATAGWHHVAVVYDGSKTGNANRLQVWIDNVAQTLAFTGTIPATLPDSAENLYLGNWSADFWNGDLDDFAMYRVALTPAEVGLNYQRRRVGRGLFIYLPMDEGTGSSAADKAQTLAAPYDPAIPAGSAASPALNGTLSGPTWIDHP